MRIKETERDVNWNEDTSVAKDLFPCVAALAIRIPVGVTKKPQYTRTANQTLGFDAINATAIPCSISLFHPKKLTVKAKKETICRNTLGCMLFVVYC